MSQDTTPANPAPSSGSAHARTLHASRAPTPRSCGCGLPVAFDPERQEFFCIGCGSAKVCTCGRFLRSSGRPVNVV